VLTIYINLNIDGEKLNELFEFIIKRSDSISVARYYTGFIDIDQFTNMQTSYKNYIYTEDKKRRDNYNTNTDDYQSHLRQTLSMLKTESDVLKYFDNLLEQDLEAYKTTKYSEYCDQLDSRFVSTSNEFIKKEYSRITPVTRNPVFELVYFKLGQISNAIISNLKGLYDYPYFIDNKEYEDLAFYNKDELIFAICSHERYAHMILNSDDYGLFKELNITHQCEHGRVLDEITE
jgi:hypothetical protein